ncbi:DUF3007 family protein [Prochlorothrix hollandica]|uniref:DUF3007 domain-containing protein n=1 Tax=Prochlorothrix hollandica PCC 9006 = CALU 1027 TaxID=317619 RepID=A0A0M2PVF3_PROHO|nr:DUF3007 family protein [Prochlorothrix hollandica]KKJ00411.1 hypothetical protein PROH_12280 [Prochlorothrix hollandica PCC 9006 = CALU 1027]
MRRIDAIGIGLGLLLGGGVLYLVFQQLGYDSINAGLWSQGLLVVGLLGWVGTYLFRVATQTMTYSQQWRNYEQAALQRHLESLSPEELSKLQAEVDREKAQAKIETAPAAASDSTPDATPSIPDSAPPVPDSKA